MTLSLSAPSGATAESSHDWATTATKSTSASSKTIQPCQGLLSGYYAALGLLTNTPNGNGVQPLVAGSFGVNVGTNANSGVLTLDAYGTTLNLFFGNQLVASATDKTLTKAGGVGIIDSQGYSSFTNFQVLTGLSFSDSFQRAPSVPGLGSAWSNDLNGGFQINGSNQAVQVNNPANELSVASVVGENGCSADVQATIAVLGSARPQAGLVADWNAATQSGYALLVATTRWSWSRWSTATSRPRSLSRRCRQLRKPYGGVASDRLDADGLPGWAVAILADGTPANPFTSGSAGLAAFNGSGAAFSSFLLRGQ